MKWCFIGLDKNYTTNKKILVDFGQHMIAGKENTTKVFLQTIILLEDNKNENERLKQLLTEVGVEYD